jgi:hypothetical protein
MIRTKAHPVPSRGIPYARFGLSRHPSRRRSQLAEPSSNADTRPVSRRQALVCGSSLAAGVVAASSTGAPAQAQQAAAAPVQHPSISLAQAKRVLAAAERRARQIGVPMFIVVVDDCGVIKASSRMDGNSQASVTLVPPKAPRSPRQARTPPMS